MRVYAVYESLDLGLMVYKSPMYAIEDAIFRPKADRVYVNVGPELVAFERPSDALREALQEIIAVGVAEIHSPSERLTVIIEPLLLVN